MTVLELLTDLQRQGFSLRPLPGDKLEVRPASKLTDQLRAELKQRKLDLLAVLRATPFPCPACGAVVRLDPAEPEEFPTRFWTCTRCGTWGSTREGAVYPTVWLSSKTVH